MALRPPTPRKISSLFRVVGALVTVGACGVARPARAQEAAVETVCMLRAAPDAAALAGPARRSAARRTGRTLEDGPPLEDATPRALGPCVLGLARQEGGLALFGTDRGGALRVVEVGDDGDAAATARALAVALSSLLRALDTSTPGAPAGTEDAPVEDAADADAGRASAPDEDVTGEDDVGGAPGADDVGGAPGADGVGDAGARAARATPPALALEGDVHVRPLFSPARGTFGTGVGLALGLCVEGLACVSIEADGVVPEEDRVGGLPDLSYAWGSAGVLVHLTPLRVDRFVVGAHAGVTGRVAHLWREARPDEWTLSTVGVRGGLEAALGLDEVWALALSLGLDAAFEPTRWSQGGRPLFLEDVVTPWLSVALRGRAWRTP